MHKTHHLLATITKSTRHLHPYQPTGLTGLVTHPAPRPHLIHLYTLTLQKLARLPESSAYRQSTEALTKHRLNLVVATLPEGHGEWKDRLARRRDTCEYEPERRRIDEMLSPEGYVPTAKVEMDDRVVEFDGEEVGEGRAEGPGVEGETDLRLGEGEEKGRGRGRVVDVEDEPPLTVQQ